MQFFFIIHRIISNKTIEIKFNELSNNVSIKLINGLRLYISLIKRNIDNEKILKQHLLTLVLKTKKLLFALNYFLEYCHLIAT